LNNDKETVTINANWIVPPPVNFYIQNVTDNSAELIWQKSNVIDFAFYRILLSTNSNLDPNNDKLVDITDINHTSANIINLTPNTDYFVSVLVVDTELRFDLANMEVKTFTTLSTGGQQYEISYDDGSAENWYIGLEQDEEDFVLFTSPVYPVRLISLNMYLNGPEPFTALVRDQSSFNILGEKPATGPGTNEDWVSINMENLNIILNADFVAGLRYTGAPNAQNQWLPAMGYDTNNSAGRSFWYSPSQSQIYSYDENVTPGNLMFRVIVETSGGTQITLEPNYTGKKKLFTNSFIGEKAKVKNKLLIPG